MSYYLFKDKRFISVGNKIFPLALYADSSVYDWRNKHCYHWIFYNITDDTGLLIDKTLWEKERAVVLEKELQRLSEFKKAFPDYPDKTHVSIDSYCYSGNSYPSGKKVKSMHAFNSIRKKVTLDDVLRENYFFFKVAFWYYDKRTYSDVGEKHYFTIRSEEDLVAADAAYREFYRKMPEDCGSVVDIQDLNISGRRRR